MTSRTTAFAVLALLSGAACAPSPETKLVSSQYRAALDAYARDLEVFEDAWIAEIDRLLRDLGDALEARAVNERIRMVSAEHGGFSSAHWEREVARGGLVSLAAAIEGERDRVRAVLETLEGIATPEGDDPEAIVGEVMDEYRRQALAAIDATPGLRPAERQRLLAGAEPGPFGADAVANDILRVIVTWRAARAAVPRDLDNLAAILDALQQAQASVDRWIQTDVSVPGEDVAALVEAWSAAIGDPE
jgi:hypothetical protein